MALSLYEASKLESGDIKRAGIIQMFAEESPILAALPFTDITGNAYQYLQEGQLPAVGFRGVNEGWDQSTGIINSQTESLRIAGGELDVDTFIVDTHGEDMRATHEALKVKSMALTLGAKMINGDSVTNPREFDGLRVRIGGSQLIEANGSNLGTNTALSLEALDTAIDQVPGATHIICSLDMRRKLTKAAKDNLGGDMVWDKDDFGNRIAFYNDIPLLIADEDSQGQRILQYNEVGPAGGTDSQSIYVVKIGEGSIEAIQNGSLRTKDLGEIDSKPVYRTRIDWNIGLTVLHGRAAARIWGIQDAPVTA